MEVVSIVLISVAGGMSLLYCITTVCCEVRHSDAPVIPHEVVADHLDEIA